MTNSELRDALRGLLAQIAKRSTSATIDQWCADASLLADQITPSVIERRSGHERRQGKDQVNPARRNSQRRGAKQIHPDTPVVGSISITSEAPASMAPSDTYQLTVQVLSTTGAILTGRTVTYTTTVEADASVSAGGLVTAVSDGSSVVKAHCENVSSAGQTITVETPQGALASLTITPASGALAVSQTQQVQGVPRDASANFLPGLTVTWGTSSGAIATVSADSGDDNHTATVTAVGAGVATITGTCGAFTDTYVCTVTAVGAYSWMTPLYTLPTGLTFNANTGAIDGTVYEATYSEAGAASDVTVTTQAQLQTQIDAAAARAGLSIIRIAPSTTVTGQTTLKARSQVGWTYVISTQLASLPSITAGNVVGTVANRVSAASVTNMPVFELNAVNGHHFQTNNGATNYYLRGLAFKNTANHTSSSFLELAPPTDTVNGNYPDEIVIQQCYFHGGTGNNVRRAVQANTRRIAIMDNYCESIGSTGNDSQWISSLAGVGPYRIVNNYSSVGGASENILFGGSQLPGSGETFAMQDIEVRGELWEKPVTGAHKNHFEIKIAKRVLVEACIARIHNGQGQPFSINIKLNGTGAPRGWCQDVLVRFCDISNSPNGIVVSASEEYAGANQTNRIEFQNNLVRDLVGAASVGHAFRFHESIQTVSFHHNTLLAAATGNGFASCLQFANSGQRTGCVVQYNVMAGTDATPTWCVKSADGFGEGETAFAALVTGGTFANNLCVATGSLYPNQTRVPARANILFTDLAGDDYRLTASSPGYHAGPSGEDLGANITMLNTMIAGVE